MKFDFSIRIGGTINAPTLEAAQQALDDAINFATLREHGISPTGIDLNISKAYIEPELKDV